MNKENLSSHILDMPRGEPRRLAIGWLLLAIGSLVLGGVLTVLIVLSRTPGVQTVMPWMDFFHTAIVVHVDLTVLVWFLSFAGVLWSLNSGGRGAMLGWLALAAAVTGTVIFTLSPFAGAPEALMNNYIPVLQDSMFLAGLGVFGAGIALLVARGFISSSWHGLLKENGVVRVGLMTALWACAFSLFALLATYVSLPPSFSGRAYYELLFWGGGHVLQFTHTQLMLVAWLWLAASAGVSIGLKPKVVSAVLLAGFAPVLAAPVIYALYAVDSVEHIAAFTKLMQYGGGLAPLIIGAALVIAMARARRALVMSPEVMALSFSILLFGAGGVIGYLISGINVTIPAHYHGSIVAVTLAFMGLTYHLLPRLGFDAPDIKPAKWQPAIYGGGQLLHVLGLAWSGGYGVQRKTAGAAQGLHNLPEIAGMAVMGLGGLIAVAGGVLFLVIVIKAIWRGYQRMRGMRVSGNAENALRNP